MSLEGNAQTSNVLRGKINGIDVIYTDTYKIAVQNGYEGTIDEWLASLKGDKGDPGKDGVDGVDGVDGKDGKDGVGIPGTGYLSSVFVDKVAENASGAGAVCLAFQGKAGGESSLVTCCKTSATGNYATAHNLNTKASSYCQNVWGRNNIEDTADKYINIVGNSKTTTPSNAHTLDWSGNGWFAGDIYVGGKSQDDANAEKLVKTSDLEAEIGGIEAALDSFGVVDVPGKNLFDKNAVSDTGTWVSTANGKQEWYPNNQYIANYCVSDKIPVVGGSTYVYTGDFANGNQILRSYCVYTKDGAFIKGVSPGSTTFPNGFVLSMPNNAGYIIINLWVTSTFDTIQLELGDRATSYQPYGSQGVRLSGVKVNPEQMLYTSTDLLHLPKKYDLVVGDTFELFYKGVMLCKDPYRYNILVTCDIGNAYARKFTVTPTAVGSHALTIKVFDDFGVVIDEQSTELVVTEKMSSPAAQVNVLCMGDSLTASGQWVDEAFRRLTKTSAVTQHNVSAPVGDGLSKIAFVGKKTTANGAGYEGTGGWRFCDYLDTSNANNPFLYNGAINFASYCSALGINKIDQCYILLGWNMADYDENTFKADAKAFINLLIAHNSAMKIVLVGLQMPAYDGLGNNYGATGTYANYRALQEFVFNVAKWHEAIAADYPNNVSCINISGQFDTENNMPTTTEAPNTRSTETVVVQNNGVHPATAGYYQIADAVYRKFTADNA